MEKRLTIAAGAHGRRNCPVSFEAGAVPANAKLVDADSGQELACQIDGSRICWILDSLAAGGSRAYVLSDGQPASADGVGVCEGDGRIDVLLGTDSFASYLFDSGRVRPFLNPVVGPTGASVVRELFEPDGSKEHDHIHHRGILVAHGDVNGTDNWSESQKNEGPGRQVHVRTESVVSGPVFGRITARNDWVGPKGDHVLFETRQMTFWNVRTDVRMIDFAITFEADARDVRFGDTKEGGLLSVRVPTALRGDRGGHMTNVYGAREEKECWGKRAHWCDYFGVLDGAEVGVSVFDHALNFRHPTYWHIRNYGLFAANPFGLSHYYNDKARDGSYTLAKGSSQTFRYRVYVHKGDTVAGQVAEAYHGYVNPPQVVEEQG
ncbi:MAG: PmoA family protein [Kiritimatiellae bacterium]|nr:PmoA family protein [Kiritimatiellia bacterium]